jgi:hypothetical protein
MKTRCNVIHQWQPVLVGMLLIMLTPLLVQGYTGVFAVQGYIQNPDDPNGVCDLGSGIYTLDSQTNVATGPFTYVNPQFDPDTGEQLLDPCTDQPTRFNGGGFFDVVILPDGKTAAVSAFGDSTILFLDISNPANPVKLYQLKIPFFAEDMALTPNGKYLLVADGGFTARLVSIEIQSYRIVQNFEFPECDPADPNCSGRYANAVVVDRYNNVFVADYFGGAVHVFHIDPTTGIISDYNPTVSFDIIPSRPVNITLDRDGNHLVAISSVYDQLDPAWPLSEEVPAFWVFQSDGPGAVTMIQTVTDLGAPSLESGDGGIQSAAYALDGTAFYYDLQNTLPDAIEWPYSKTTLKSMTVNPDGTLTKTDTALLVTPRGTSQLFGVDTMDFEPTGQTLYLSNPTVSGAQPVIDVVDIATLQLSNIVVGDLTAQFFSLPVGMGWQIVPTFALWSKASTGQGEVWQINPEAGSAYATFALQHTAGWEAVSLIPKSNGTFLVLWNNGTTGQSVVWNVNMDGVKLSEFPMQYTTGWQVTSFFPNAGGTFWVVWSNVSTGQSVICRVNAAGTRLSAFPISQSAGWGVTSLVQNADGTFRVLWSNASTGQGAIWQVSAMDESGGRVISQLSLPTNSAGWKATSLFPTQNSFVVTWTNASTGQAQVWTVNAQGAKMLDFPMQNTSGWRLNGYEQSTQGIVKQAPVPPTPAGFLLWTK